MSPFPDAKLKTNGEKSSQVKCNNSNTKLNGDDSITNLNDNNKKDQLEDTKEPIVNGTENSKHTIVNGDPKKDIDCDISSSDNAKVVSNGLNCDSDDTKSNKSDEEQQMSLPKVCPMKAEGKQATEKKKDSKKAKVTDHGDSEKKKDSSKSKNTEIKKEEDKLTNINNEDKVNGDSKNVNGEKERESSPSEDGDEKKRDAEVVFIQDMGFTVKIMSPGAEPLDIQVYISLI